MVTAKCLKFKEIFVALLYRLARPFERQKCYKPATHACLVSLAL